MHSDPNRILDQYLVCAARVGDGDAWRRLVCRWQPKLLAHAWRLLGNGDRARDAVQDAWVDIWRGLAHLEDAAAFPAWAYKIVTRRTQRSFQVADRERLHISEDQADSLTFEQGGGEHAADLALVMAALRSLPAPQRSALALFYLEDMSVAEVAVALDVPPGTVKTRLMHARNKLRAKLEGASDEQNG